jgi:hypothetical protein
MRDDEAIVIRRNSGQLIWRAMDRDFACILRASMGRETRVEVKR